MSDILTNIIISCVSGLGTSLLVNYFTKENIKKEITFGIIYKDIIPNVYIPIIQEYRKYLDAQHSNRKYNINISFIETTIINNLVLINFTPNNMHNIINNIYSLCKTIKNAKDFDEKEPKILVELKKLEDLTMNLFKELVHEQN